MFWTSFTQPQQFGDFWVKAMKDQIARVEAMQKEMEKLEQAGFERTNEALEESAKLTREAFAYTQKLGAEWRKVSLDALKKSSEMLGASA